MSLSSLFIIAVGLSMDAFAVSVCKGLALKKMSLKTAFTAALYFGGFQALMPLVGFFVGVQFEDKITSFDHWIAFVMLAVIGGKMIKEAFDKECVIGSATVRVKEMLVLAVATSIDALATGVMFAFLIEVPQIYYAVAMIGATTFILSAVGVKVGNVFGCKYKSKAELAGGIILVIMGLKILVEHISKGT
jgi:putative Mn2+ efflux pump MntP